MHSKNLLLFLNFFVLLQSYKILVVNPRNGYSHVNFFSQIADILTDEGHDVTVLTIDLDPTIKHPGAYKAKVITYPATKEIEDNFVNTTNSKYFWNLSSSGLDQYKTYVTVFSMSLVDNIYNDLGLLFTGSFLPNHMSPFSDKITYKERFQNVYSHYFGEVVLSHLNDRMTLQKKFNEDYGK
uniref:Glucuronosyltransferase n=1 Tax=Strongyloides venezuelensis TaxID=75913 RepID=A0A0K0FIV6_STRVS